MSVIPVSASSSSLKRSRKAELSCLLVIFVQHPIISPPSSKVEHVVVKKNPFIYSLVYNLYLLLMRTLQAFRRDTVLFKYLLFLVLAFPGGHPHQVRGCGGAEVHWPRVPFLTCSVFLSRDQRQAHVALVCRICFLDSTAHRTSLSQTVWPEINSVAFFILCSTLLEVSSEHKVKSWACKSLEDAADGGQKLKFLFSFFFSFYFFLLRSICILR